jgi:hypothetical protein
MQPDVMLARDDCPEGNCSLALTRKIIIILIYTLTAQCSASRIQMDRSYAISQLASDVLTNIQQYPVLKFAYPHFYHGMTFRPKECLTYGP